MLLITSNTVPMLSVCFDNSLIFSEAEVTWVARFKIVCLDKVMASVASIFTLTASVMLDDVIIACSENWLIVEDKVSVAVTI